MAVLKGYKQAASHIAARFKCRRKNRLKGELVCRKCGAFWKYTGTTNNTNCPYCGASKDARDRSASAKKSPRAAQRLDSLVDWSSVKENSRKSNRASVILIRKRVFFRICGSIHPKCVRCGCDDSRLLEINHKNGGGNLELQKGKRSNQFYRAIAKGLRPTDDLELLCKPCNAVHALELKFGPLPFRMTWQSPKSTNEVT